MSGDSSKLRLTVPIQRPNVAASLASSSQVRIGLKSFVICNIHKVVTVAEPNHFYVSCMYKLGGLYSSFLRVLLQKLWLR
jgi:hypothetical protein